jgi:hypothetical protein
LNAPASSHNKQPNGASGNAQTAALARKSESICGKHDAAELKWQSVLCASDWMYGVLQEREFMADLIVVYWRDIPAQVIVKKGRQNAKRELPLRFTEAIDMCAMRTGAGGTDDYLAEWRKAEPVPVGDDLEAEAEKALQDFEAKYDRERLVALVKAGGKENV